MNIGSGHIEGTVIGIYSNNKGLSVSCVATLITVVIVTVVIVVYVFVGDFVEAMFV